MTEGKNRQLAAIPSSTSERSAERLAQRPDRIALWAFFLAIAVMVAAAASAHAGSGGVGLGGGSSVNEGKYARTWSSFKPGEQRWAHRTSKCESGQNPRAIGGGGAYRGAFQFTKPTWKTAPKSPGGDPIKYRWKTQAVVAVLLKHHEGTRPWPVCG